MVGAKSGIPYGKSFITYKENLTKNAGTPRFQRIFQLFNVGVFGEDSGVKEGPITVGGDDDAEINDFFDDPNPTIPGVTSSSSAPPPPPHTTFPTTIVPQVSRTAAAPSEVSNAINVTSLPEDVDEEIPLPEDVSDEETPLPPPKAARPQPTKKPTKVVEPEDMGEESPPPPPKAARPQPTKKQAAKVVEPKDTGEESPPPPSKATRSRVKKPAKVEESGEATASTDVNVPPTDGRRSTRGRAKTPSPPTQASK
jgi:hypothetical protein